MSTTAPISGVFPDPAPQQASSSPTESGGSQTESEPAADQAGLRLVIEDDEAAGTFVYLTINWVTGQIVSQIPRERLLRLRASND